GRRAGAGCAARVACRAPERHLNARFNQPSGGVATMPAMAFSTALAASTAHVDTETAAAAAPLAADGSRPASAPALPEGRLRAGWRRVDAWLARPLDAQQIVLRLALYLMAVANAPLWLQLA